MGKENTASGKLSRLEDHTNTDVSTINVETLATAKDEYVYLHIIRSSRTNV